MHLKRHQPLGIICNASNHELGAVSQQNEEKIW